MDEELVKGITAMVVDDDRDCAGAMAKFLELHGAVVETADRGAEALLILREREFDVVSHGHRPAPSRWVRAAESDPRGRRAGRAADTMIRVIAVKRLRKRSRPKESLPRRVSS